MSAWNSHSLSTDRCEKQTLDAVLGILSEFLHVVTGHVLLIMLPPVITSSSFGPRRGNQLEVRHHQESSKSGDPDSAALSAPFQKMLGGGILSVAKSQQKQTGESLCLLEK